jgi:hypothetical protein
MRLPRIFPENIACSRPGFFVARIPPVCYPSLPVSLLDRIQTQNSQVKSGVFNPLQNFFKISLRNTLHQGIRCRFVSLPRGGCIGVVHASTAPAWGDAMLH